MTFILLNEVIGDAVVEAVIPAFYSSILLLAVSLYSVSLFALLFPFCIVIGVINYYTFIYRPAASTHTKRKEAIKKLKMEGVQSSKNKMKNEPEHHNSSFQEFVIYVKRVLNIMKHGLQNGITNFSNSKVKKYNLKTFRHRQIWRN